VRQLLRLERFLFQADISYYSHFQLALNHYLRAIGRVNFECKAPQLVGKPFFSANFHFRPELPREFQIARFANAFTCIIRKLGPDYFSAPLV